MDAPDSFHRLGSSFPHNKEKSMKTLLPAARAAPVDLVLESSVNNAAADTATGTGKTKV